MHLRVLREMSLLQIIISEQDDVFEPRAPCENAESTGKNLDTDIVAYAFNAEVYLKEALSGLS